MAAEGSTTATHQPFAAELHVPDAVFAGRSVPPVELVFAQVHQALAQAGLGATIRRLPLPISSTPARTRSPPTTNPPPFDPATTPATRKGQANRCTSRLDRRITTVAFDYGGTLTVPRELCNGPG